MRAVDGVAEAVGVLRGDYLAVSGPDGRATAQAVVSDIERLAAVQQGMVGAVPSGALQPGADPIQIIESTEIARQVGKGDATAGEKPVEIGATVDRVLGLSVGPEFLIVDEADYEASRDWASTPARCWSTSPTARILRRSRRRSAS